MTLSFWKNASPKRKRIYSLTFVFVLSITATLVGMLVPLSPQEAQLISDQLNQTVSENTVKGTLIPTILLNNLSLCLLMFIPLAGFAIGLFILFSTGMAIRAILDIQSATACFRGSLSRPTSVDGNLGVGSRWIYVFVRICFLLTRHDRKRVAVPTNVAEALA